jgi:hypothetical protein
LTPAAVGGFQPTQIPGLTGWYDGSDSATITVTGTQVTQWLDKSGSNNTITPLPGNSNATLQPAYQNGRSVVNFSGNNLYRAATGSGRYPSDVYLVIQLKSISRYDVVAIGELGGDSFNSLTLRRIRTGKSLAQWIVWILKNSELRLACRRDLYEFPLDGVESCEQQLLNPTEWDAVGSDGFLYVFSFRE